MTDAFMTVWPRFVCRLFVLMLVTASLGTPAFAKDNWDEDDESKVELHGFVESATSSRFLDDPTTGKHFLLGEARFRLDVSYDGDTVGFAIGADFIADAISRSVAFDIRSAYVTAKLWKVVTLRAGRQILTWGTGDLLFINDLFPKDFVSFLVGRNNEFLKAPSNAVKISIQSKVINIDLVWLPIFESDRFITGERLSFYNPAASALIGGTRLIRDSKPELAFKNSEGAIRLYRRFASWELALYGFIGFYKQPSRPDATSGELTYARLATYGLSVRGPVGGGLLNLETAYFDSLDDQSGRDPGVPNSQVRALIGYERSVARKLTLGVQYYAEWTLQHDRISSAAHIAQLRHIVTARLSWSLLKDDLRLSIFALVGISDTDVDAYLRPSIRYKISDAVALSFGANIMFGPRHTFYGQLAKNSNIHGEIRYTF